MKPLAKKIGIIALLFVMGFVSIRQPVHADSLYVRKFVSVVYDDSGSMSYDSNWVYANYAMQTFAALMNGNDQLFITYMSKAEQDPNLDPPAVDLSNEGIQASVDQIRAHGERGNTPYDAVDVAFSKLCSVQDDNPNTEYWLVVLTDGEFQDRTGVFVSGDVLNRRLSGYVSATMPNGTNPQITYFAIGKNTIRPDDQRDQGIYVYESSGTKDIVRAMSEIANRISGRTRLESRDLKKTGRDTLRLQSDVPLLNIAVLSQESDVSIVEVSYEDGGTLNVARQVSVAYPQADAQGRTVRAQACLINNGDRNINAGTYSIKFDGPVDLNDLVVMYEPALELRMRVIVNGAECQDLAELANSHEGDIIDVVCEICEIGTGTVVSPELLPNDTRFDLSVLENGTAVSGTSGSDMTLEGLTLSNVLTELRAEVEIPGLRSIRLSTGAFTPGKPVVYSIDVEEPENFSFTMDSLKGNTRRLRFVVYEDGIPVSSERMKQLSFRVETEMPGKITYEPDGAVSFTPLYRDPVTTIPTGTISVKGILNESISAVGSLYVKPVEYEIRALGPTADQVDRKSLTDGQEGLRFALYADGRQLDRQAVEAAELELSWNAPYRDRLEYEVTVDDLGSFTVIPRYEGWSYLIPYRIPAGELELRAAFQGGEATSGLELTRNLLEDILLNYLVPALILTYLLGSILKKRFNYSLRIAVNQGVGSGLRVSGPKTGWSSWSLFTPLALVPIIPDRKTIMGVCFHAEGRFSERDAISVKPAKLPAYSGLLDGELDEMKKLDFAKNDVEPAEGRDKLSLSPGKALVTSSEPKLGSCAVYLYIRGKSSYED